MKILFVTNHQNGYDGYSRYSLALIEYFSQRGDEVRVITSQSSERPIAKEFPLLKPSAEYLVNIFPIRRDAKKIQNVVDDFDPDIIHFVVEPYAHMAPFIRTRGRKVLTVHGTYSVIPNVLSGLKKYAARILSTQMYKNVDAVVAVSNYTLSKASAFVPYAKDKMSVIPNGIDLSLFPKMDALKSVHPDQQSVLLVGAVTERKGVREAILGLHAYREKYGTKASLTVVGSVDPTTEYTGEVLALISKLGMKDSVHLLGRVSEADLTAEYEKADVFLMPTINRGVEFEGFGLVYLEANAFGLPVIGGRGSGAEEAISEGESGFLVDSEKPEEIGEALHKIFSDAVGYQTMSQSARRFAEAHSWEGSYTLYEALYTRLLSNDKPS